MHHLTLPQSSAFVFQLLVAAIAIYLGWTAFSNGLFDFTSFGNDDYVRDGTGQSKRANRNRLDIQGAANELSKIVESTNSPTWRELFSDSHQDELLWGSYRPQLYYGMRTRVGIDSILFGMMWYESSVGPFKIRILSLSPLFCSNDATWFLVVSRGP